MASPFVTRHIGPRENDINSMLDAVGYNSLDALVAEAIGKENIQHEPLELPEALTESEVLRHLRELARRNTLKTQMIGLGYYDTVTPAVVRRQVLENPAWYTAYTPYQPEISQGRLEALLNFQTMVSDLVGLPTANASLLDEAVAAAEAMTLMHRAVSRKNRESARNVLVVDEDCLPQTIAVVATRAEPLGLSVIVRDLSTGLRDIPDDEVFGVLAQYPGASGRVRDLSPIITAAHERGAMVAVAADLLALTLLKPPGEMGADVVVGTTQRFGVPLGYGGPHAAYIAVRDGLERMLPGRLVGVSKDAHGNPAYRLALQTREQHIRRERATSNICTAQVLLAVVSAMYAVWHGPRGLRAIASAVHERAVSIADALRDSGIHVEHDVFFDTLLAHFPQRASSVVADAAQRGVNIGLVSNDVVRIACDEATTDADIAAVLHACGVPTEQETPLSGERDATSPIPDNLRRTSDYLTHPVFNTYHSETSMLRYLRQLSDKDYALDRGMIPLGSCTMKLNAAAELEPITWPEFAGIHPFAPASQAEGYRELISQLEDWLATITGYDAVSVQPNAGSQGELAGLLAIRAYYRERGDRQRNVCLIPSSAHGTNAASAVLAGMKVVVVAVGDDGAVDLNDVERKLAEYHGQVAAIMVTYPSTHGVYEDQIVRLTSMVHDAGAQVYMDGANLNALIGVARLSDIGADVSHLNLHKTFCIPHGGGGPGVGPVAVKSHLASYLPSHPLHESSAADVGPISAAPFGSASILPISWSYIRMMGSSGLTKATYVAVLSANYIATRLRDYFPVLYTGNSGLVAHECILDLRPLTKTTGITVDDVAKRLIDYGFHAPTMSFPVAGTFMVEPTESEDLTELDRFCDAMIAMWNEAEKVRTGEWPADDNPLRNAPHTAHSLTQKWDHPYERAEAVYPTAETVADKYWSPVGRIDGAYGDRNLVCACPPVEAFSVDWPTT